MAFQRSFRLRLVPALALLALSAAAAAGEPKTAEADHWRSARQLVLVIVPDWNAGHGKLRTFTRGPHGWAAAGIDAPVVIGKNGAAWGLGLNELRSDGPVKHEGDDRSPAGVFRVGTVFGYATRADTAMPYRALSASDYCVDVSGTAQYNRIVDATVVGEDAVKGSTEPMRRDIHVHGDQAYRLGFNIEQNPQAKPLGGSCIFGHLWKSPSTPTAGCTAMTPAVMQSLVAWLKPQQQPVFVLLPQSAYLKLREHWQLPRVDAEPAR
ncbi:L,D-transpeptidase family protein [Dyella agri]|uniref:L,D-peptidoglycan transpeptidase YkuD, ErfK/YbiS/YcfS/YnhG family n=1 Tax=Dyella agri TaxID=1926869 RepID=A0ABW8KC65_9GAMM